MEDPPINELYEVRYCERANRLMDVNGPVAEALREYLNILAGEEIVKLYFEKKGENKQLTWEKKGSAERRSLGTSIYLGRVSQKVHDSINVDACDIQLLIAVITAVLDAICPNIEKKGVIKGYLGSLRTARNTVKHKYCQEEVFKEIVHNTKAAIKFLLSDSAQKQEILDWLKDVEQGVHYVLDDTPLREYQTELKNTVMMCVGNDDRKRRTFKDTVSKCFGNSGDDPHVTLFDSIDNRSIGESGDSFAEFIEMIGCREEVNKTDEKFLSKKAQLTAVSTVQLKLKDHQSPPTTCATIHRDITKVLQEKGYKNPRIELISVKRGCIELIFTMSQITALSLPSILVFQPDELAHLMKKIGNPVVTLFECLQFTPKDNGYEPTFLATKNMQEDLLDLYREWQTRLVTQDVDPKLLDNLKKSQGIVAKLSPKKKMPEQGEEERSEELVEEVSKEPKNISENQKRVSRDTYPLGAAHPQKDDTIGIAVVVNNRRSKDAGMKWKETLEKVKLDVRMIEDASEMEILQCRTGLLSAHLKKSNSYLVVVFVGKGDGFKNIMSEDGQRIPLKYFTLSFVVDPLLRDECRKLVFFDTDEKIQYPIQHIMISEFLAPCIVVCSHGESSEKVRDVISKEGGLSTLLDLKKEEGYHAMTNISSFDIWDLFKDAKELVIAKKTASSF